ncbi:WGxxGxxG family protein [Sphingomonas montana]|uniref:WGxxGxxG family protein n=1 Tax=Sphingomonas montana TaxID=1843236 RepID=UPI00096D426A|nr:WGxxGxxG family protein [Sphingomonas montana]
MKTRLSIVVAASALAAITPATANAQSTSDGGTATTQTREDDDFPWGLLGLVGLAGLIPRKRPVHVDTRTAR